MGEGDAKNPLKSLEEKIAAAKKAVEPAQPVQNKFSAAEVDFLFNTKPVFILILTLFGFVAGVKTMMRSARELQKKELSAQDSTEEDNIDG